MVGTDQVLLELSENPAQVKAGMSGEVVEILSDRGVAIETTGSLIQGIWGNGQVDFGVLSVLAREHGEKVSADQLDLSMRGAVILGIHCDDEAFLRAAQDLPVRCLILASMIISLRAVAERMDFPVLAAPRSTTTRRAAWTRSPYAPRTRAERWVPRPGVERHRLRWEGSPGFDEATGVKQEIWLEPLDSDVLFGSSNPRVFELAQIARPRKERKLSNDEFRIEHGSTLRYTVTSELASAPPRELRAAAGELPVTYGAYFQVPELEITKETRLLAAQITAGLTNNYDKAVAIERWLETNLSYTLELRDPGKTEPVHFFLFERKKGHCEYSASAFVVLARLAGIPARQVNGFLGGEWNEYQSYVAVRAGDAHSWAEVYFPGPGVGDGGAWVTFDPTARRPRSPRPRRRGLPRAARPDDRHAPVPVGEVG